jgi:predicted Zn finger-like uncharacterized protein
MLTHCPACATTFRVTPEQLKARAGKVRCGKCQTVFNALDSLAEASPELGTDPLSPSISEGTAANALPPQARPVPQADADHSIDLLLEPASAAEAPPIEALALPDTATPEAVRDSGMAAGLIAARETTEIPGYNKWAEGAFTAPVSVSAPTARPAWPFVLAALLLLIALGGQIAHHYRAELAVTTPALRPLLESICEALDCEIPLPRHVELVSIEASDLQVDPAQGGALTLSATLKNRAAYAQAWPLLEITLTDVQDNAVLRRVLQPGEYLPAKADPTLFPPNGEIAVRLWLETKELTAAGYRLYVFYP